MSAKQDLMIVKKMIDKKRYDEARDILATIDHPKAKQWLNRLDRIAPVYEDDEYDEEFFEDYAKVKVGEGDGTSPVMYGVIAAVVVVIIAIGAFFVLSQSGAVPTLTDNTGCGGQDWWNGVSGTIGDVIFFNPYDTLFFENIDDSQIHLDETKNQQKLTRFQNRLSSFRAADFPECVESARAQMITALEQVIEAIDRFNPDSPRSAFTRIGRSVDAAKTAAYEMTELGVSFWGRDADAVNKLTNTACPAYEWTIKNMYVDNQFMLMIFVIEDIFSSPNILENVQSYIFDLRQQKDRLRYSTETPACMNQAREHLLNTIEGVAQMFEAALGLDLYGMNVHYETFDSEMDAFYVELKNVGLDPEQFGSLVKVQNPN